MAWFSEYYAMLQRKLVYDWFTKPRFLAETTKNQKDDCNCLVIS